MKEIVVRDFFDGLATARAVANELAVTRLAGEPRGFHSSGNYRVEPMATTFALASEHVVRLVDAVTSGDLSADALDTLVFCLEAQPDRWLWDTDTPAGVRVANTLLWLGSPEINYPLSASVLAKIRHYLLTGENTLSDAGLDVR